MYICDKCHQSSNLREKMNKIIVKTREVEYHYKDGKKFKGWEIVKEIDVCIRCMDIDKQEVD